MTMKLFKGFIIAIVGLFIVITLFSLMMPSRVMTVRSVVIQANAAKVFAEISDLQNWKYWHPVLMQHNAALKMSDPTYSIKAFVEWETNAKGYKLTIVEVNNNLIKISLKGDRGTESENIIAVTPLSAQRVQVEWRVFTKLRWYPWEKFSGIFIDKMTGPGYDLALHNLKELAEKTAVNPTRVN